MKSVFNDKNKKPTNTELKKVLGKTYLFWNKFIEAAKHYHPAATEEWVFSSEKFGWSFRVNDKKRVLIYLLPREGFFKTAFVFGQKATYEVLDGSIADEIKSELKAAKKYGEGRGIRIEVKDKSHVEDILQLIQIKINN